MNGIKVKCMVVHRPTLITWRYSPGAIGILQGINLGGGVGE